MSITAFPGILFGAVGLTLWGLRAGLPPSLLVMAVVGGSAAALLVLQHFFPRERQWRGSPKDFSIDLVHMLSTGAVTDGTRAVTFGLAFLVAAQVQVWLGMGLWPTAWPVLAQLALAVLVSEVGAYWVHRLCHEHPWLWRIHALHHTSERLYVFSSGRNHPLNVVATISLSVVPLAVLGAPPTVLALTSVFTGVHGLLQHANVAFRHGPLNWVFSTADYHRWHHSLVIEESNGNYGSNLIWLDMLFGTRFLPADRETPVRLGAFGLAVPENIGHHLALPFAMGRYETVEVPIEVPVQAGS